MKTDLKTAALAAADWLEANRDKHITGDLAIDASGNDVRYNDPDADCFCALGRLGKELGLEPSDEYSYAELTRALAEVSIQPSEIFSENDRYPRDNMFKGRYLASCDGVEALRRLAKGEPIDD